MFIPWWVYLWLVLSSVAVIYDTFYIHLRPLSFRYNPYEWTFEPYQLYRYFDTLKDNMQDRFLVIQSWLNVAEVGIIWLAMFASVLPWKKIKFWSAMMLVVVSSFVFWKTVIYLWYDRAFVTVSLDRLYSIGVVFYYFTIGLWVIFPPLTVYAISARIMKVLMREGGK